MCVLFKPFLTQLYIFSFIPKFNHTYFFDIPNRQNNINKKELVFVIVLEEKTYQFLKGSTAFHGTLFKKCLRWNTIKTH